mmetsp:Transcript_8306/g.13605  ORF Transcript_8306/g.13605 Transcript_8306/m.13605 type:complete len:357 (+) Transcript_8306:457-1527(+)
MRDRHQHRGGLADHRRHLLRGRPRLLQAEVLQPHRGHGLPRGHALLPGVRPAAGGARGPHGAREVLPAVHRGGLQDRDDAHEHPRDPADQPGQRRAAAQGDGHQRPAGLRFHGPAAGADADRGHGGALLPGRPGRRGPAHPAGAQDGRVPPGAAAVEAAHPQLRAGVQRGGPDGGGHAQRGEPVLPPQGQAGTGGHEESQVLPARGRPPDAPGRVQGLGAVQVQQPLVLREFHPGPGHEALAGRAQAARHHHGPVQDGHRLGGPQLRQGAEGNCGRLLHELREEGSPGRLPHHGGGEHGVHPPLERDLQQEPRVGAVPRAGADHQGVHAQRDGHRAQVAGRARAPVLPGGGRDAAH